MPARGPDLDPLVGPPERSRREDEPVRADGEPLDLRAAAARHGPDRREVLRPEPGRLPPRPDPRDRHALAREGRERDRGPDELAAALEVCAVELEHHRSAAAIPSAAVMHEFARSIVSEQTTSPTPAAARWRRAPPAKTPWTQAAETRVAP